MNKKTKICIVGGGTMGTSLGNALAPKPELEVSILTIEEEVAESINTKRINIKYFPYTKLSKYLHCSTDKSLLQTADIVFLAIPSSGTINYVLENQDIINPNAILVNLAKGLSKDKHLTIAESLTAQTPFRIATFKGPTFARELINNMHTAFTVGCKDLSLFPIFKNMAKDTCLHLDYTTDLRGVELLSVLKNAYAIGTGIVDAQYDSPNLRFLFLTKAFSEMRAVNLLLKGKKKTLFKYCGFGDFGLTALNDLSRNRTLGLLIGKGFYSDNNSDVILEGKKAIEDFCNLLAKRKIDPEKMPILHELKKVFNEKDYDVKTFLHTLIDEHDSVPKG